MLGRTITFSLGACLLAVVVARPSGDDQRLAEGPSTAQPGDPSQPSQTEMQTADWLAGDHTLQRAGDGHFYANAYISGSPVRMMVDTGASVIALTEQDAISAGLYWDDSEIVRVGTGASGAVYGVPAILGEVEIGGMTRYDVDAVVIPEGLPVSLLGQSYLSQIGSVQIADDRMIMSVR